MTDEQKRLAQVSELFDDWAASGRAEGMERGHTPTARQAFDCLKLQPSQHYLDIGCGNGYTVRWAAERHASVQAIGLDLSEGMVTRARALSSHLKNTRFIHAPFPLPLLKAQTFDAIFSMEVFYYLPDLTWGVVSTTRLLKPGGLFACTVDFYEENEASHDWPDRVGVPLTRLSARGWRQVMEDGGLEVIEQRRLIYPLAEGEEPDWRHTQGSLMTLSRRP